ncbi:hypothetical protein K466DRAFT_584915 [Polyporus arcularius HHB13444]|uniref:Uncharacterized protein n=1 Tax=Polyporus arcularius HHB13444 TaxID=1314778 RepID=A0A5C3PH76_9APHY|nr:hypothetical protein K466DRAFT_584915 [Polyporus arcularius HHB13444]
MSSSRAQPARQGRDGISATPLPRGFEPYLKFQLNELVVLTTPVNDVFPGNQVVRICNFEPQPQSGTSRPGQGNTWQRKDDDTLYRFARKVPRFRIIRLLSPDAMGAPVHVDLPLTPNGMYGAKQYEPGTIVYPRGKVTFSGPDKTIVVPPNTACMVLCHTSKLGREFAKAVQSANGVKEGRYILQVRLETYFWEEVVCNAKKEVYNFRKATAAEIEAYNKERLPGDALRALV